MPGDTGDPGDGVGAAKTRREDRPLLTGEASFTDDLQPRDAVVLAVKRAQYGHATIQEIETNNVEDREDVVAVYTAADVEAADITGSLPTDDPDFGVSPTYPLLATDRVRYQGQPVAAVVARDNYVAADAVDAIDVSYDRLDAVTDMEAAVDEAAPTLHEAAPNNVAFEWDRGDADETAAAFDAAEATVSVELTNNRVIPTPMEPRAAVASYRPSSKELTVELSTQNPHSVRGHLNAVLDIPEGKIRVRPPSVGGGFGAKLQPYPGPMLAAWAATQLEAPVKWQATRTEAFQGTVHARSHETTASLAVDGDNNVTAIRVETMAEAGAYLTTGTTGVPTYSYGRMLTGQYDIPSAYVDITGVFTNTTPTSAYRGAGRPEAAYVIERLMTAAARELGEDPTAFRRQNFIDPDQFPYDNPLGHTYDSGDYETTLDEAMAAVGYDDWRATQADDDRLIGVGVSCYVEACGGSASGFESGLVRVHPSGEVTAYTGTQDTGQGHRTSFAQIVADELGVAYDDVTVVEGDTDRVPEGRGTAGSRSAPMGGNALRRSAEKVVSKAREIAAHELEAAPADIEVDDGEFHVAGAPSRSVTMADIADAAYSGGVPDGMEQGLESTTFFTPEGGTFPFGTHIAVVEIDADTGAISFEDYVAVDDVGEQINPTLVEGQIHGGIAQGVGQALLEEAGYDDNGNLVTGSLQDYAMPRAESMPEMRTRSTVTPSPNNPMGVKGVGEAGTIGAPPAVVNAVYDAVRQTGASPSDVQMPLSDDAVWELLETSADGG